MYRLTRASGDVENLGPAFKGVERVETEVLLWASPLASIPPDVGCLSDLSFSNVFFVKSEDERTWRDYQVCGFFNACSRLGRVSLWIHAISQGSHAFYAEVEEAAAAILVFLRTPTLTTPSNCLWPTHKRGMCHEARTLNPGPLKHKP